MKKLVFIALAVAAMAAASCSQYKYETVKGDPLKTKIYTLDNGLQVYMTVNKEEPRIQTYIAVKVGAKNDPLETTGLAHYFEHLMFKGTEQFGTADYEAEKPLLDEIEALFEQYRQTTDEAERTAIYKKIDEISYEASKIFIPNEYDKLMSIIGADGTNAWTSKDETVYTEDIPSNQIDNWARIQADRFRHPILRGFHTELETIYEEKNMSITQDSRKMWQAIDEALYPHHPYGMHDVLGFQEHLKNPSITNVKNYHDQYYVPNNIRICLSGDFNPDEMVAAIEKYFGDWEPNPDIPVLEYESEAPITEPLVRDIYGKEAERVALAWRLPGASDLRGSAISDVVSRLLYNGQAGMIDLDVMQQQKVLNMYAFSSIQPDYGQFLLFGYPKAGQTLDQVCDIALEEIAKLRGGDFDETLIESTINNFKLEQMYNLEGNSSRAVQYVDAFINGIEWKDASHSLELLSSITKDDVIAWVNEYLGDSNFARINKLIGEDTSIQKVSAPSITPIQTNRDKQSEFLTEIQNTKVNPIEPVFVDFDKDMSVFPLADGIDVLYKHNDLNDIFSVSYVFNTGFEDNPILSLASSYFDYLGTETMSAEEFASKMYALACSWRLSVSATQTSISIEGLGENMSEAVALVEDLLLNAVGEEDVLADVKSDIFKSRSDSKLNQNSCFSALRRYQVYGKDFVRRATLDNDAIAAIESEDILKAVSGLFSCGHEVEYYGPAKASAVKKALLDCHNVNSDLTPLDEKFATPLETAEPKVLLVQYDSPQIYYIQFSNRGEKFDLESEPGISLYNEYFGGGMNTIVFQEMREARGLAYSASAYLSSPYWKENPYTFLAFIATQNDKMKTAVEAFDEIINQMPQSQAAFDIAKEALISRIRTQRTTGVSVLGEYLSCRRLGLDEPTDRLVFETVQNLGLEDIVAVQEKMVKDRVYSYAILGDIKNLDTGFLKTLGPVEVVSLEDVFGY